MSTYIASSEKYKELVKEDILIRDYLIKHGIHARILTLEEILRVVQKNNTVILKSIWGYHINSNMFLKHLSELKKRDITLINDYPFIYWNINKFEYISDLQNTNQINVIPTKNLSLVNCKNVYEIRNTIKSSIDRFHEKNFVIKPKISASGFLTFKYSKNLDNEELLSILMRYKHLDFMIQPFRNQIKDGEISIIIIKSKIRYAIRRYPGILSKVRVPEFLDINLIHKSTINQTNNIIDFLQEKFNSIPQICRIDFVKTLSDFELMEIELIDPDLCFKYIPNNMLNECLEDLFGSLIQKT